MKEEIIMQKKYYKSIVVGAVMLLILALSATGCGKNTGEQVKQLIGPEKTDTKETSEPENINGAATENPESASDPGAVDEDENENEPIQTSGSDSPTAEKAIDNPVFVKGFIPDGKGTIIYDFYYLDLDTGEMNKFFTFESKDLDFHEDIKNLITNRSFMGDTRLYDPYIRSDLLFNEDMTAIAVQWRESDQSAHVGWCDSEGNVTDVTDKIYNTKSDFDRLPNNHYPLFGPDNSLWFYDYNLQTYRKYDIDTGRVEDPEEPLTVGMTDILYVIYGEDTIKGHNIGSGSLVFSGDSIQRYNYINEHAQYIDLIPQTDWRIQNVAYSGGKIVFDATRGDQYKVFLIDNMNGVSEPKAIYSEKHSVAGDNPMLLFWRDPELRSAGRELALTGGKQVSKQETEQKTEEQTKDEGKKDNSSSGDETVEGKEAFFNCGRIYVDNDRLLHIDEKFFGMTYEELGSELNMSVPEPADFPWWGMELESSEIYVDGEPILLIFQDDKLAVVDYEYQGSFDEEQWDILCSKTGITGQRDKFDEYKDRGYLDPGSGKCYYYINYDYEQNGRGDIMVEKYYWRGMKWD